MGGPKPGTFSTVARHEGSHFIDGNVEAQARAGVELAFVSKLTVRT